MALTIIHSNDFHGKLTEAKARRIRELKDAHPGAIYLDSGDCIKAGNLAVPLKRDPAWALLALAGCDAIVLGNRETHPLPKPFLAKLEGAAQPVLCANLRAKDGARPLGGTLMLEKKGYRVGVVAVMVPMVTARMATSAASAYLWDPPIPAAAALAEELRPQVDCLIGLTHIGLTEDRKLASACPNFDLILGGHSHNELRQPERIGKTFICQAGAFGKSVGVYEWERGQGLVEAALIPLPA